MLRCVDIPTVKARNFHGWVLLLYKRAEQIAKLSTSQGAVAAPVCSPDKKFALKLSSMMNAFLIEHIFFI